MLEVGYTDLLKICDDVFDKLSINREQAQKLEKATRNQHQSKLWLKYRQLKAAVHTGTSVAQIAG